VPFPPTTHPWFSIHGAHRRQCSDFSGAQSLPVMSKFQQACRASQLCGSDLKCSLQVYTPSLVFALVYLTGFSSLTIQQLTLTPSLTYSNCSTLHLIKWEFHPLLGSGLGPHYIYDFSIPCLWNTFTDTFRCTTHKLIQIDKCGTPSSFIIPLLSIKKVFRNKYEM
jgi:hypothetical protein